MRTVFQFPQNGVDADVEMSKDKSGNPIVIVTPYFWTPDQVVPIAFVRSETDLDEAGDNVEVIQREAMQLAGGTGGIRHVRRATPVKPRFDLRRQKEKADPAAAKEEE